MLSPCLIKANVFPKKTKPDVINTKAKKIGLRLGFRDLVSLSTHMQCLISKRTGAPVGATLPSDLSASMSSISEEPDTPSPAVDRARLTPSNIIEGRRRRRAPAPADQLYASERHEMLAADVEDEEWCAAFEDQCISDASVDSEGPEAEAHVSVLEELMSDLSLLDPLTPQTSTGWFTPGYFFLWYSKFLQDNRHL